MRELTVKEMQQVDGGLAWDTGGACSNWVGLNDTNDGSFRPYDRSVYALRRL